MLFVRGAIKEFNHLQNAKLMALRGKALGGKGGAAGVLYGFDDDLFTPLVTDWARLNNNIRLRKDSFARKDII